MLSSYSVVNDNNLCIFEFFPSPNHTIVLSRSMAGEISQHFFYCNNSGQHLGEMAKHFHRHSLRFPCAKNLAQYLSFSAFLWFYLYLTNLCGVKEPLMVIALLFHSFKIAQPFEPLTIFSFHLISTYYIILCSTKFRDSTTNEFLFYVFSFSSLCPTTFSLNLCVIHFHLCDLSCNPCK
jgi:hypothetical protein